MDSAMTQHAHAGESPPFLAHQFDTPRQQFEAGKLGMWVVLVTEVLFFSGLFCAYLVYRSFRPEVFVYAHYFLDTKLGAINTAVLLVSSLSAAWAVRNAQLGERRKLVVNIGVTLACALIFLGIKCVEYAHKYEHGLLPGKNFNPTEQVWELESFKRRHAQAAAYAEALRAKLAQNAASAPPARTRPTREQVEQLVLAGVLGPAALHAELPSHPQNAHTFFGLYFLMTGVHALHVLIGIGVWTWLLIRAWGGEFGPSYAGPIDYAALYWHLVDLIWIYLFPLLYLIH
jgi:cytochrome c oxidase subunit 3